MIGAQPVGSVEEIRLAPDGQANVTFTVDEEFAPLRRGTVATVRWASLSSVANRQIQLTPPAEGVGEEIPDGGVLTQTETITDVEVDQFFNMLDDKTVKDFKRVIKGFATSYEGVAKQANRGYKYLNPMLYNGRRVFAELSVDQAALERLLVDGSRFAGALADRSSDLPQLVHNLNLMMNAIGDRKLELARAISLLPPFMRNANTTFVNLRAALDDLQPLVIAGRPAAKELRPFLVELRATARNAVPTVRDLSAIIRRPGDANDLIELQRAQPRAARGRDRLRLTRVRPRARASGGPRGRRRRRLLPGQLRRGALLASQRPRQPELLPRLHAGARRLVRRLRPLGLRRRDRRRGTGRADAQHVQPDAVAVPGPDRSRLAGRAVLGAQHRQRAALPGIERAAARRGRPRRRLGPVHRRWCAHRRRSGRLRPDEGAAGAMRRIALILASPGRRRRHCCDRGRR